jgi:hypothetical protein
MMKFACHITVSGAGGGARPAGCSAPTATQHAGINDSVILYLIRFSSLFFLN